MNKERATVMASWDTVVDALRDRDIFPKWHIEGFMHYKAAIANKDGVIFYIERLPENERPQRPKGSRRPK